MKTKGNEKIRAAQKANEEWVLAEIREKDGFWSPQIGLTSIPIYNAIDRLVEKKVIRWSKRGYGSGYVEIKSKSS